MSSAGYEIDFLPVGDGERGGDAICLRYGNLHGPRDQQHVVVVDAGFRTNGQQIVEHIAKYYDTDTADLVVATHPDGDHCSGLQTVLEEMTVAELWMHRPWNHTADIADLFSDGRVTDKSVRESLRKSLDTARALESLAGQQGVPIKEPFTGLTHGSIRVLGPTPEYYESLLPDFRGTPEARGAGLVEQALQKAKEAVQYVGEALHVETLDDEGDTSAENNSSAILLLSVDSQHLLLTGDAGIPALTRVAHELEQTHGAVPALNFIQVPHHGSRRNVGPSILDRLIGERLNQEEMRRTAFVSAPNGGNPKHPAKKVVNAFRRRGAWVHATQGSVKRHHRNAPTRPGYSASEPLPLYEYVEE